MSGSAFYVSTAIGAVALFVEAHRQFATRTKVTSNGRFPLLEGVQLEALAPPSVYLRGYWFYVGCYLLVYFIAVSVVGVGDLVINSAASVTQSGAQGALPFADARPLIGESGDTRPLLIAVGMITVLSTGLVARVERFVRNFAHGLAGIPSRIFRVITRLNQIDYAATASPGQYSERFKKAVERFRAAQSELLQDEAAVNRAASDFRIIDTLEPPIIGVFQDQVFSASDVDLLDDLIRQMREEADDLSAQLDSFLAEDPEADAISEEHVAGLLTSASKVRRNIQALFAVLYTKSQGHKLGESHQPTTEIVRQLAAPERSHLLDSMVGAGLICFFLIMAGAMVAEAAMMSWANGQAFLQAFTNPADRFVILLNSGTFAIAATGMALTAAILTIQIRRGLCENENYEPYKLRRVPWSRLIRTAFWPALLAGATVYVLLLMIDVATVLLAEHALITTKAFASSLTSGVLKSLCYVVYGLIIGLAVLLVADQHDDHKMWQTICIGLGFAVLPMALISTFLAFATAPGNDVWSLPYAVKDALMVTLYAAMVIGLFAFLVERAEDH